MSEIQLKLKAPKGQFNSFGKYKYRSCEDIVEAVKPVLGEYGYHLNMSDDIIGCGDRVYIKATCRVMEGEKVIAESTALAREAEIKKGMDDGQVTGTSSSYARKYALNGLFAIDDTKDTDTNELKHELVARQKAVEVETDPDIVAKFEQCGSLAELKTLWESLSPEARNIHASFKNEVKAALA
jgi:hypothetical protein